jgi:hypothetical protein
VKYDEVYCGVLQHLKAFTLVKRRAQLRHAGSISVLRCAVSSGWVSHRRAQDLAYYAEVSGPALIYYDVVLSSCPPREFCVW